MSKVANQYIEIPGSTNTASTQLTCDASGYLQASGGVLGSLSTESFLHVQDQKPSGTDGGTFAAGSWVTRDLNTVVTNTIEGASLASNSVNLPAGTYYIEGLCPAYSVYRYIARLTDGLSTLIWGLGGYVSDDYQAGGHDIVKGLLTLTENTTVFLEHACSATQSGNGFGIAVGHSLTVDYETYTDLKIWKVG